MCGIIGYIGQRSAVPILLDGLRRLEYRGYDSAGLCTVSGGQLVVVKRLGRVEELASAEALAQAVGGLGIAHTRWATHGEPNQVNAHPHLDCSGALAVVHNGIIENHQALRQLLEAEGHTFVSATDTEVVAHLIEKLYAGDLEAAVQGAVRCLEGTYGLAVTHRDGGKVVVARRGSPLLLGLGDGETFVASDATAVVPYTDRVVYLSDGEVATITELGYTVRGADGQPHNPEVHRIRWSAEQIEKRGYPHFMLKEIFEQPEAIENTLRGRLRGGEVKLSLPVDGSKVSRVIITACGTSWHSALIGKHLIERLCRLPVEVDYASELRYRDPVVRPDDLVVVISQSGETADTLAAAKEAKGRGAKVVGLVNVVGSTIAREVDGGIYLHAGPEIGVASTKAFSCQVVALLLLALYLRQSRGQPLDPQLLADTRSVAETVRRTLEAAPAVQTLAQRFTDARNFLFLGRGLNFPVALEGALKLKEISYIHAEGYPAAEMKHGPIALVDDTVPSLFVAPHDHTYEKILSNIQEVKARRGPVVAVVTERDEALERLVDHLIVVPAVREELAPLINVIPLQLFAYHVASLKGLDVDKPRNLAKSVTVE